MQRDDIPTGLKINFFCAQKLLSRDAKEMLAAGLFSPKNPTFLPVITNTFWPVVARGNIERNVGEEEEEPIELLKGPRGQREGEKTSKKHAAI